jgi:hypothetical protein
VNSARENFRSLGVEIYDTTMALLPRGWRNVSIPLERIANDSLRLATTDFARETSPSPNNPDLGIEPESLLGNLTEAIRDLDREVRDAGFVWSRQHIEIVRTAADEGRVILSEGPTIEIDASVLDARVYTEALFDLLTDTTAFEIRQREFSEEVMGHDEWNYDSRMGTLTLERGVLPWRTFTAQPIGSYAFESGTWLWAWANTSLPASCTQAACEFRASIETRAGLGVLRRPSFPCAESFAARLAAIAAAKLGARGIYRATYGPGALFLMIAT